MYLDIEKILKLSQEELLGFCYIELIKRNYRNRKIEYNDDYLYAKGNIPVLLVAHTDIVHKQLPELIVNDRQQRILWSPTGIGGDDRCGVYAILKICEKFKPYVLFTTEEEVGGLGVKKFVEKHDNLPVNFIIEIDRRGFNQVVFYECGNKDFQNYILSFGLDKQTGSYSDVSTLSTEFDIAGCNMSAGYYKEHTTTEHIVMEDLENTIKIVKEILRDKENHKFYDCQQIVRETYTRKWDCDKGCWNDYYGEGFWNDSKKTNEKEVEENNSDVVSENKDKNEGYNYITEDELIQIEEDYYVLTPEEFEEVYGFKRPKDIVELYDTIFDMQYENWR